MPYVQITWLKGRTAEQKRRVAQRVTEVIVEETKAPKEAVHVVFVEGGPEDFADAGVLLADRPR